MTNIFQNVDIMTRALDASWKRNEVITNNIANVNTPNFKRSRVEFETILRDYLDNSSLPGQRTKERHIAIGVENLDKLNYRVTTSKNFKTRRDGNNVDIDVEMGELAKNTIVYNSIATKLNSDLKRLKIAITGGRG